MIVPNCINQIAFVIMKSEFFKPIELSIIF